MTPKTIIEIYDKFPDRRPNTNEYWIVGKAQLVADPIIDGEDFHIVSSNDFLSGCIVVRLGLESIEEIKHVSGD